MVYILHKILLKSRESKRLKMAIISHRKQFFAIFVICVAEERGFEPLRHHWPTRFRDEPLQPDLGILPFKKVYFVKEINSTKF